MSDEFNPNNSPYQKQLNYRKPTSDNRFRLPYNVSLISLLWSSENKNKNKFLFNKFLPEKVESFCKFIMRLGETDPCSRSQVIETRSS